jgi:hypothetical protein
MFISSVIKYYNYIPIILNIDGKACDRSLAAFLLWDWRGAPGKGDSRTFWKFSRPFPL